MFSSTIQVIKPKFMWPLFLLAVVALVFAASTPRLSADPEPIEYDDLEFFIEVNDTDGDAGVQLFLDGEQWKSLKMFSPDDEELLDVEASESLNIQGLTEFFFESAEPSFDDVPLDEFLDRFPEGEYSFSGMTIDGDPMEGTATFTHDIPDAPVIISPEEDDDVEIDEAVIEWEPVTGPPGIEIVSYEVIVENEETIGDFKILLPPTKTSVTIPEEFFDLDVSEYKGVRLCLRYSNSMKMMIQTREKLR